MWEIEFFIKDNNRCPTKDFLDDLSPTQDLPYINNRFKQLEEHGNKLRRPHADFLEDGIWELRVKTRSGQFRFFYFFFDGIQVIITHGLHKKTRAIPRAEIKRAQEYRSIYLERQKKEK